MINAGFAPISSTIDSDHSGHLLISVQNASGGEAKLVQGQPFCTVVFFANVSPSTKRSNNTYDEHEIVESLLATWSRHRGRRAATLWPAIRPLVPILFVAIAAAVAFASLGSTPAFGGVMAGIAAIGVLMQKFLGR